MYKSEKLYYKDFEEIVSFVGSKAAELFRSGLPGKPPLSLFWHGISCEIPPGPN